MQSVNKLTGFNEGYNQCLVDITSSVLNDITLDTLSRNKLLGIVVKLSKQRSISRDVKSAENKMNDDQCLPVEDIGHHERKELDRKMGNCLDIKKYEFEQCLDIEEDDFEEFTDIDNKNFEDYSNIDELKSPDETLARADIFKKVSLYHNTEQISNKPRTISPRGIENRLHLTGISLENNAIESIFAGRRKQQFRAPLVRSISKRRGRLPSLDVFLSH